MIAIVLGILKWIGIFVLVTLGLAFFLILLILLVPVRYRLQGARSPQEGVLTANGKVSWLLSLLAVTFSYDQEFSWRIRICGIPLRQKEDQTENDIEDLTEEQLAQITALEEELAEEAIESTVSDDKVDLQKDLHRDPQMKSSQNTNPGLSLQAQEMKNAGKDPIESETAVEKVPLWEKLCGIWQKVSEAVHSIPAKIIGIKEKICSMKEQADIWLAFIRSEEVKQLLAVCKKQIRQILRHLIPSRLKIRGNYGFEDPSLTGKITGFLCALPSRFQKDIRVQPHFQEECLDGEIVLQGRIRLGSLLWPLILIVVRPCTWKVYKKYRSISNPKPSGTDAKASSKGKKDARKAKKKSGKTGDSHKNQAKSNKKRSA